MDESRKEAEKRMEAKIEKQVEEAVTTGVTIFVTVAVTFFVTVIVLKFVWAWVVPDLFPGAVDTGLIVAKLDWLATVKLAVLVSVLSGVYQSLMDAFKRPK